MFMLTYFQLPNILQAHSSVQSANAIGSTDVHKKYWGQEKSLWMEKNELIQMGSTTVIFSYKEQSIHFKQKWW